MGGGFGVRVLLTKQLKRETSGHREVTINTVSTRKYLMSNKYNICTLCTLDHAVKNEEFAVVMVAENAVSLCCPFSMIYLSLTLKLCCI